MTKTIAEFDADQALMDAAFALRQEGVEVGVSPLDAAGAVLLAEGVNWAAKALDCEFYAIKAATIAAAAKTQGVAFAWGGDERGNIVLYLTADGAGEASFHDPFGELVKLFDALGLRGPEADDCHAWSGVRRQHLAFACLKSAPMRRLMEAATSGQAAWGDGHLTRYASRLGLV